MVEIRRMGPQIGVEVTGVDVKTLDDSGFAPIYRAWLDCNILAVRDQYMSLGVELEPLAGELLQHVIRHDDGWLASEAQAP